MQQEFTKTYIVSFGRWPHKIGNKALTTVANGVFGIEYKNNIEENFYTFL